ncbi:MAG: hypothetical protein AAFX65_01705 [Cyanobacteria bacterium J06638_7]
MQKSLVIHFGAQKCGSSSIQSSLSSIARAGTDSFRYQLFDSEIASGLSSSDDQERTSSLQGLDHVLKGWKSGTLILSHEQLGNLPASVNRIAERAITRFSADQVIAIGYSRIQSSYFQAEYRQWYFRAVARLRADMVFLEAQGLRADHFTPVERRMMVEAFNSFAARDPRRDWFHFYTILMHQAASSATPYVVKSNHIPTADRNYSLLADFVAKTGILCSPDLIKSLDRRANVSFSPVLCEAMAVALCNQTHDCAWIPGPHQGNAWLGSMNAKVSAESFKPTPLLCSQQLLRLAASAVDANFRASNYSYCELMNVERDYFDPGLAAAGEPSCGLTRPSLYASFKCIEDQRSLQDVQAYEQSLMPVLDLIRCSQPAF